MAKRMVEVARYLRRREVRSEKILWEALRDRRLDGVRFKRQQPIDRSVVDFFAPAVCLVVEVDGAAHDAREDLDRIRQAMLENRGLRFVRVRSDGVERDLQAVLARIRRALIPLPLSREAGEGEGDEGRAGCHAHAAIRPPSRIALARDLNPPRHACTIAP